MIAEGNTFFFPWEVSLMEWLQAHFGPAALSILSFFSSFGEELVMVLILCFIYWSYDKRLGKALGLSVLMGLVWAPMIKNVFLRRRPYFDHEKITILRVVEPEADIYDISAQGYSFPSGHSANAASLYGALAAQKKRRWLTVLGVAIPLLVGVSRVVVGAHYPTDVLVGWVLGVAAMLIVSALRKRIQNTAVFYAVLLAAAVPGFFFCRSADYFTAAGLLVGFAGGTLLEEKRVQFESTRNPIQMILRLAGGIAVYFALNAALKLPFDKAFLNGGSYGALLVRCARYAVVAFVGFGVYPMLFKTMAKIGAAK